MQVGEELRSTRAPASHDSGCVTGALVDGFNRVVLCRSSSSSSDDEMHDSEMMNSQCDQDEPLIVVF